MARILGDCGISIASVIQHERRHGEAVPVILMTHTARESELQKARTQIDALDVVRGPALCVRVEE